MSQKLLEDIKESITTLGKNFNDGTVKVDSQFKLYEERIKSLESALREQIGLRDKERATDGTISKKKWGWARFAFAVAKKDWTFAPFEKEECDKHRDMIMKTMTAGDFTAGGALIPPQYIAELIGLLRPKLVAQALGVRMLTGLTGSPVIYPKIKTGFTGTWIAPEGTSITASDQITGQLNLTPHMAGALTKISNNLVLLSNPSVEQGVRDDLVNVLRETLDKAIFQGTGILGQPLGLLNWTPAITSDADFDATDAGTALAELVLAAKSVENANASLDNAKWAMNPTSYWKLAGIVDANKRSILQTSDQSGLSGSTPTTLLGYPVVRSTLVSPAATDDAYFGSWDDFILAMWNVLEIAASTETSTAFEKNELWIRAILYADCGPRHEGSFYIQKSLN